LDVDWCPNFSHDIDNPPAILQLYVGSRCIVFQILHADYIPDRLADFLKDKRFTFVGVGVDEGANNLDRHWGAGSREDQGPEAPGCGGLPSTGDEGMQPGGASRGGDGAAQDDQVQQCDAEPIGSVVDLRGADHPYLLVGDAINTAKSRGRQKPLGEEINWEIPEKIPLKRIQTPKRSRRQQGGSSTMAQRNPLPCVQERCQGTLGHQDGGKMGKNPQSSFL
ncbi:hypothetical protein Taro_049962, partial [Colocasia esculenta]|nr:hypothetical protein [Colocasia esculenta]